MKPDPRYYGMMAEFENADQLLTATKRAYAEGYRKIDAYTPYPVEGLAEATGMGWSWVPLIVLVGAILGGVSGYALEYWVSAIAYPLNVGGRPYNSWPLFVPVIFEMTILIAALFGVFGMLALNGLPMPYHPVFNVPRFDQATRDRFFLVVQAIDPKFDKDATRQFLHSLGAREVADVPQ